MEEKTQYREENSLASRKTQNGSIQKLPDFPKNQNQFQSHNGSIKRKISGISSRDVSILRA